MRLELLAIVLFVIAGLSFQAEASGAKLTGFYCQSDNTTPAKLKTPPSRKIIPSTGSPTPVAPTAAPTVAPTIDPPKNAPTTTGALDADKLILESLGIRFRPISGAILTKPVTGAMPIYTVDDSRDPPRYHLQIQTLVSGLSEPNPQSQVNEYLESMRKKNQSVRFL